LVLQKALVKLQSWQQGGWGPEHTRQERQWVKKWLGLLLSHYRNCLRFLEQAAFRQQAELPELAQRYLEKWFLQEWSVYQVPQVELKLLEVSELHKHQ
jgi:hypothetical protein